MDIDSLKREFEKLAPRLEKSGMDYNKEQYHQLHRLIDVDEDIDYISVVYAIDNLIEG
jgi:hypothetical protein